MAVAQPPPAAAPAATGWAPPPPLPSATTPAYRPLQPADAPANRKPAAPAGPTTRPVLTLQKPAGADAAKDAPKDPKTDEPKETPKADRDPPKAINTPAKLFRLDGEGDLLRRITGELLSEETTRYTAGSKDDADRRPPAATDFEPPTVASLARPGDVYQPKTLGYPPAQAVLEPGYVVHRRLYFEELNSERYGWEVGLAQPAISTLLFWKDTVLFPAKLASHFGEWYDTSAGKCPPGSPLPYKLYPEPVDAFGLLVGTGAVVGTVGILSGL